MTVGQSLATKEARSEPRAHAEGKRRAYLYGVIAETPGGAYGDCGIGGGRVYSLSGGRVTAVVSDVGGGQIRPDRSNLAAHQQVLMKLLAETTPLPMSFGIVADSPGAVRKLLARNQRSLLEQLRRVAGRVEMGLRVTWDVANIFEYFVNTHAELREARDRLLGGHGGPTQEHKIELGRMFDYLLNEDRELYADRVEEILSPDCAEFERKKCRSEFEVMNLACLVDRQVLSKFETKVFEVARQFDNNFACDYNGPWPPHNFVELDLEF
jgi:gas vesicle protein GvpL/GvpF